MNDKEIKYVLPGFLNISRNEILINIYKKYPHITRENTCIHSFFGNFPSCIWNGGRVVHGDRYSKKEMIKIRNFHNKNGIAIALTMTNLCIKEEHLSDKYCNEILSVFHNNKNEVLVSTDILEEYIRKNYPKYKINRSITSTENSPWIPGNYNLSLLAIRKINDFEYIKKIPVEQRKKMEILCNEPCRDDCKYKYIHYYELSHLQLGDAPSEKCRNDFYGKCRFGDSTGYFSFVLNNRKTKFYVSPEDIVKKYLPLDIHYFKINGREKNEMIGFLALIDYCIKPEYQNDVLTYIMERTLLDIQEERRELIKKHTTDFDNYIKKKYI